MKNFKLTSMSTFIVIVASLFLFGFKAHNEVAFFEKPLSNAQIAAYPPTKAIKASPSEIAYCFSLDAHSWEGKVYAHATNRCSYRIKAVYEVKWWDGSKWVLLKGFGGTRYQSIYLDGYQSEKIFEQNGKFEDFKITPISDDRY
jgi:hypothetical protein